jgi:hypothetical protein
MKTTNGNLPAMPKTIFQQIGDISECYSSGGLTKREMFAMAAMQGFCADIVNVYENLCGADEVPTEYLARQAVFAADALLAELERQA